MPFGHLDEGDTITVHLGDTSQGSPGIRLQSCAEQDFRFTVLVDPIATAVYVPVAESPVVPIVAGAAESWHAVLPSLRRPGQSFRFGVRAEDRWGNPTYRAQAEIHFEMSLQVVGLPATFSYISGCESHVFDNLTVVDEGVLRVTVLDDADRVLAVSTPLVVSETERVGWWADLHGQSGESVGINTARHYFGFARDIAFLDASAHQANDFQVNNAFWQHLNELTASFNVEGEYVVLPGYEWSANTHLGGDRNVFFRTEGRQIHRSSHALLPDVSDIDTDANDAPALFEALRDEDVVVFAHVGGRWADLTRGHDGRLETAMEIHSAWGTFEWLMADAFKLGFRVGVVANSDGHKGRPGASHPSTSEFAAYGGLTCLLASELTRDAIFDCLRRRRHFATTGNRLHLDVGVHFPDGAHCWERDPAIFDAAQAIPTDSASMGDIVSYAGDSVQLEFDVVASSPIEKVEVRNAMQTVAVVRPYATTAIESRVRVLMSGADRRGKGSRSRWRGRAQVMGARVRRFASVAAWNPELPCELTDERTVEFRSRTAGNMMGFDIWLEEEPGATLQIQTNHGDSTFVLCEIGYDETSWELGGLQRRMRLLRLPDENPHQRFQQRVDVPITHGADNPLWVCVTTEDAHQAWSSPVYVVA
jgi:hypothetical protein